MSQANKGEPWRQAMNDQIAAAAAAHPELRGRLRRRRAEQRQAGGRRRELPAAGHRPAHHLAERSGAADRRRGQGVRPGGAGHRARPQGQRRPVHDVDRRRQPGRSASRRGNTPPTTAQTRTSTRATSSRSAVWRARRRPRSGATASAKASPRNPDAKIIASQNADWLREKAIPVSQAMFQANPDVNVVYAHNDPMAEAAIISAQNAGLNLDELLFIGIDALPTPDGGIRSVLDGRIDVTYVYPTGGAQAIDYATQILEQGAVPPAEVVGSRPRRSRRPTPSRCSRHLQQQGRAGRRRTATCCAGRPRARGRRPAPGPRRDGRRGLVEEFISLAAELTAGATSSRSGSAAWGRASCSPTSEHPVRPAILYGVDTRATAQIDAAQRRAGRRRCIRRDAARCSRARPSARSCAGWPSTSRSTARARRLFMPSSWLALPAHRRVHPRPPLGQPVHAAFDPHGRHWYTPWAAVAPGPRAAALGWSGDVAGVAGRADRRASRPAPRSSPARSTPGPRRSASARRAPATSCSCTAPRCSSSPPSRGWSRPVDVEHGRRPARHPQPRRRHGHLRRDHRLAARPLGSPATRALLAEAEASAARARTAC